MVFSKEQKSAIHFKDGPALVLAGPGSGKTTVIVNRIISLIKEHSVPRLRYWSLHLQRRLQSLCGSVFCHLRVSLMYQ